jgi:hypothetical protein
VCHHQPRVATTSPLPALRRTALKQSVITPLVEFYHDSLNLVRKCNKPDRKG